MTKSLLVVILLITMGCHTHRKADHYNHGNPEYVSCRDCGDSVICPGYMGFDNQLPTSSVPLDIREKEMRKRNGQR